MHSKYIVALNPTEPAIVKNAVTGGIEALEINYWHWIDNLWILSTNHSNHTAKSLYTALCQSQPIIAGKTIIIVSMDDASKATYWGRSPKESWEWMQENWGSAK